MNQTHDERKELATQKKKQHQINERTTCQVNIPESLLYSMRYFNSIVAFVVCIQNTLRSMNEAAIRVVLSGCICL